MAGGPEMSVFVQDQVVTILANLSTNPSYLATSPSYPATNPSYLATNPSYPATSPSNLATNPSYLATSPSYLATNPSHLATRPASSAGDPLLLPFLSAQLATPLSAAATLAEKEASLRVIKKAAIALSRYELELYPYPETVY